MQFEAGIVHVRFDRQSGDVYRIHWFEPNRLPDAADRSVPASPLVQGLFAFRLAFCSRIVMDINGYFLFAPSVKAEVMSK